MTTRARWPLRVVSLLSAVAPLVAGASCSSLDGYASLQVADDAASLQTGGHGGAASESGGSGSGGIPSSSGGKAGAGGARPADAGSDGSDDARTDANAGGKGGTGGAPSTGGASSSGGRPGRDAGSDGDAATRIDGDAGRDARPPRPPTMDVFDGATLVPVPAQSTCGSHLGPPIGTHVPLIVDFGCQDVLKDFMFVDVDPFVAGAWEYDPTGNLWERANAQTFPMRGVTAVLEGSKALYMPQVIRNGMISVRFWSTDDDSGCVLARYQDVFNHYRVCLSFDQSGLATGYLTVRRVTVDEVVVVGGTTVTNVTPASPGHVIGVEFVGSTFGLFIDGTLVGTYEDPGGYTFGRVGIEDFLDRDTHFDDFTVVEY